MDLIEKAEIYVTNLFKDKLSPLYTYHNIHHTQQVAAYTSLLAKEQAASPETTEALMLAAWFHDSGYIIGIEDHELKSVEIFKEFAQANQIDEILVSETEKLILSTDLRKTPKTEAERIIRDADCAHFGSTDYADISKQLRTEWENTQNKELTDQQWLEGNKLAFTTWHVFHTGYAQKNWLTQKERNLEEINKKLKDMAEEDKADKKKDKKKSKADRGVETLFRVTLNNHTQLSQIADSKANILLSVNAIIISISLSTLIPKLDSPGNAHLVMPTFLMVLFSVVSIIFAILSTRPKVHRYKYDRKDIEKRSVNLLFFGNFNEIPMKEYISAMEEMLEDADYLHQALIKDLYLLGKVLDRKYKLLRITYNIFMIGIIVSVASFVLAFYNL
ncbi:Pycsar system effector family protein [Flavobacterium silvaticum]|uniref:Phosphohydrolase n=1 Tax=Flavobacterium silvaticum TaxID=1852020 RepID=A0A972FT99_9FLAO|nr:Pycsar system effector family protein [Flavobacterium silvaticum]NMH27592.1 phosphohydrolase [Flavobacterium silvaticum]